MNVFVTGGTGYIGSHTCVELLEAGHSVVVADNLVNSSPESLRRVEKLTGKAVPFYNADIRDRDALNRIFDQYSFDCAIHFAGLKAVGESVEQALFSSHFFPNILAFLESFQFHEFLLVQFFQPWNPYLPLEEIFFIYIKAHIGFI